MADETCIDHAIGGKCISRPVDLEIAEFARRQHGVVGRRQLLALGVGGRAIEVRLGRGALHPIHRGVYAVGHLKLTVEGRWMAAVLAGGEGAVLSHRSAGQLWGIVPRSLSLPEVTRPTHFRPRPGILAHRSSLPADEIDNVLGIPVTSVPRTLFDLAATFSLHRLERAFNEVEARQLTDRLSLPDLIARYPRRRGVANLRALLASTEPGGITRSRLEERFVAFLDAYGLPRPRLNAPLAVRGRFFEVDCLWQDRRLAVELDGRAFHSAGRAFEKDRERDRILLAEGWRVTRVTWRQLDGEPDSVAADLHHMLRGDARPPTLS